MNQLYKSAQDAFRDARNIFCVGRNYAEHARELGNAVPERPMIFGKFTHSLIEAKGDVPVIPDGADLSEIHHELEIVLLFERDYRPDIDPASLVGGIALGLDLTDRTVQNRLKAAGHPWELAKAFKNSAVVTDFYRVTVFDALNDIGFSLRINGRQVQVGYARDMIFSMTELTHYVGKTFGLKAGDMLFTGTPEGVGPLAIGDGLEMFFGDNLWGTCTVADATP